ncbi:inositol monophosphatase family protein [Peribacillus frigoritolerans]|uniref:inositol monophosphatase family protein n=1 Tax=Peribacillus frigoritolerans TaxID=450367 RepID=UPI00315C7FCD
MASVKEMDTYAKLWIKEAGTRLRASFKTKLNIEMKTNPNDLVTNMDKGIEKFFCEKINEVFPEHRIFGEEGMGNDIKDLKGTVWIIDPIDGTLNFIHQQRNFAISLGVYVDGIGKIGMVYDVFSDELYHAIKGQGAFLNDQRLPSLEEASVSKAIISINASWVTENRRIDPNLLAPLVRDARGTRSYGSAALELAFVAAGRIDAYITMRLMPWDFAGGVLLVEEVGGEVSNIKGDKLDFIKGGSLFVSKPGLHKEVFDKYLSGNSSH